MRKYRNLPSTEEFNVIFESVLDEMRINGEKREVLRNMDFDTKWNQIIRPGVIANVQTNFKVSSALEYLKQVLLFVSCNS